MKCSWDNGPLDSEGWQPCLPGMGVPGGAESVLQQGGLFPGALERGKREVPPLDDDSQSSGSWFTPEHESEVSE